MYCYNTQHSFVVTAFGNTFSVDCRVTGVTPNSCCFRNIIFSCAALVLVQLYTPTWLTIVLFETEMVKNQVGNCLHSRQTWVRGQFNRRWVHKKILLSYNIRTKRRCSTVASYWLHLVGQLIATMFRPTRPQLSTCSNSQSDVKSTTNWRSDNQRFSISRQHASPPYAHCRIN